MPLAHPLLLGHALILDVAVLGEQLVERQTPLLLARGVIRVLVALALGGDYLLALQGVHAEVLSRQEGRARVEELVLRVVIVDK